MAITVNGAFSEFLSEVVNLDASAGEAGPDQGQMWTGGVVHYSVLGNTMIIVF